MREASKGWVGRTVLGAVMGLLIISFAIWGIGDIFRGFGRSTFAKVGSTEITIDQFRQMYSYTPGGLVTKKRFSFTGAHADSLEMSQTYDNEGKIATVKYPDVRVSSGGSYVLQTGPTYTYTYDAMSRPIKLTDNQAGNVDWAKNVQYGPAGEMQQIDPGG
jgi:YD repeat-containing protein